MKKNNYQRLIMDSKEMYEALLAHLANATREELNKDWELLKDFNQGVSISEYMEIVASFTELEYTKLAGRLIESMETSNDVNLDLALAA